jgi:hypothetical protein
MGEARSTYGRDLKVRDHLRDLGVGGRILKRILEKQIASICTNETKFPANTLVCIIQQRIDDLFSASISFGKHHFARIKL